METTSRKRRRSATSPQLPSSSSSSSSSPPTPPASPKRRRFEEEIAEIFTEEGLIEGEMIGAVRKTEQGDRVEEDRPRYGAYGSLDLPDEILHEVVKVMPSMWDSLSDEEKRWSVAPGELKRFAESKLRNHLLANMVDDAQRFELNHDSLQFWFCHFCGSYFGDGHSLTMHMKKSHFPLISECQAWPSQYQQDRESAYNQEVICKMVWKPIDVKRTVQQLYMLCLDSDIEDVIDSPGKMELPLLDDDPERSELLFNLGQELKALALDKIGLSFLSRGILKRLIDVASWHLLTHLPAESHMLDFTRRLTSSPLSFCFLDKANLCHFVRVAKRIKQLVKNEALDIDSTTASIWDEPHANVRSSKKNEMDSPYLKIANPAPYHPHFFLKPVNNRYKSLPSWLFGESCDIPCSGPLHPPSHPPSFLTHVSVLSAACHQLTGILSERMSYFNVGNKETYPCSLGLVEVLCLLESWEFKVRRLCSFNFCKFMVPLMQQYFQHLLEQVSTGAYGNGGNTFRDSDVACCTNVSLLDDVKEYNPKRQASTSASRTWDADNSGIFFCVAESDLIQVIHNFDTQDLVRDAISHIRFQKSWKHWSCYMCRERFANSESHMNHMDDFHELDLPSVEQSGLVPWASKMQTERSNEIPVSSCGIFYADRAIHVDPIKFSIAFSQAKDTMTKEKKLPFISKHKILLNMYAQLKHELYSLRWPFNTKREVLRELDVVYALEHILMGKSDQTGFLSRRFEKLNSMDPDAQCSFQHRLISQFLDEVSSRSIEEVLEDEKGKLLHKLNDLDVQIMQEFHKIKELKREISELCCSDYSTDILPYVGVFLNPRIRLDGDLGSWASNRLQELLFSIDHSDLSNEPATFKILSVSIGKVLVNITAGKWGLSFDYKGMRLFFEGEWPFLLEGKKADGYIDFAGSSNWHVSKSELIQAKSEVIVSIVGMDHHTKKLSESLKETICAKLLQFQCEFVERSTPDIPSKWYNSDVPLPFPNEPRCGEDPLQYMNVDCLENVTSDFSLLSQWKSYQRDEEGDRNW